jgi:hypothetical protein
MNENKLQTRKEYLEHLSFKYEISMDIVLFFADVVYEGKEDNNSLPNFLLNLAIYNSPYFKRVEPVSVEELIDVL